MASYPGHGSVHRVKAFWVQLFNHCEERRKRQVLFDTPIVACSRTWSRLLKWQTQPEPAFLFLTTASDSCIIALVVVILTPFGGLVTRRNPHWHYTPRTNHDMDHLNPNLPTRYLVVQVLHINTTDPTKEAYPRSCRLCGSHSATRGRSHRSGSYMPWNI